MSKESRVELELTKAGADPDPFRQFEKWFKEASAAHPDLPEAMTLATADRGGTPSARMVLMRGWDENGFVFYTNYESRKAEELDENPSAALVFYWGELQRQVCIYGMASRVSWEESEAYFSTRLRGSQISAHASPQSRVISSRADLDKRYEELEKQFAGQQVPLPRNWGGYRLDPEKIEFWQGRANRLHDRLVYTRQPDGTWQLKRLAP